MLTGIGTFVATLPRSIAQAQLMLFFVNPPLMALSGGFTPIEAMPKWIQPFSLLNPIAHFATLARSVMVRGAPGGGVRAALRAGVDRDAAGGI